MINKKITTVMITVMTSSRESWKPSNNRQSVLQTGGVEVKNLAFTKCVVDELCYGKCRFKLVLLLLY